MGNGVEIYKKTDLGQTGLLTHILSDPLRKSCAYETDL